MWYPFLWRLLCSELPAVARATPFDLSIDRRCENANWP